MVSGRVSVRAWFLIVMGVVCSGGVGVRGEVPNWPVERLERMADRIVVGSVISVAEDAAPRRTVKLTKLRLLRYEKGEPAGFEAGDSLVIERFVQSLPPMTTGTGGHRGFEPGLGALVRVYLRDGSNEVILPNGMERVDGEFLTEGVLSASEGGGVSDEAAGAILSEAGGRALAASAWEEAERAYRLALERRELAEDRLRLGRALVSMRRFEEAAEAVEELAFAEASGAEDGVASSDGEDGLAGGRRWVPARERAQALWLDALWRSGDDARFRGGVSRLASVDERWKAMLMFMERQMGDGWGEGGGGGAEADGDSSE